MHLAQLVQRIGAIFNEKLRKRHQGLSYLRSNSFWLPKTSSKRLLIHCASYGEYEQAKPLIKLIKQRHSKIEIVVSFFSSSGFDMVDGNEEIDYHVYFPIDTKRNVEKFINSIQVDWVVIIKYDIWINFILRLKTLDIPLFLFSARFYKSQIYFKPWGAFYLNILNQFDAIFTQDITSTFELKKHGIKATFSGDSRADRVVERCQHLNEETLFLESWKNNKLLLVLGSVWPDDWNLFQNSIHALLENFNCLIAPHEMNPDFLSKIAKDLEGHTVLWSELDTKTCQSSVIIMDRIGFLADAYRHADVAYVGGGFRQGLHNLFEPSVYGVPSIFGPNSSGFPEAESLLKAGAAFSVKNSVELKSCLMALTDDSLRASSGMAAKGFVLQSTGSTANFYRHLQPYLDHHE